MKLELKNVSCGYGTVSIIKNISIEVNSGEILCILGPNGVGKTTLFKTIFGFLKIQSGEISVDGKDIHNYSPKELAKLLGYVPQAHNPPFPFKVIDVVLMGRACHIGTFSTPSKRDIDIAIDALRSLDILHLKDKVYTEISGGEKQLVLIARTLAQQAKMLIMDEPTSNLDYGNQIKVLNHIKKLAQNGIGIIMTSHFPNQVFLCATKVAMLNKGRLVKIGNPNDVITKESLKEVYGVEAKIINNHVGNNKEVSYCVPVLN